MDDAAGVGMGQRIEQLEQQRRERLPAGDLVQVTEIASFDKLHRQPGIALCEEITERSVEDSGQLPDVIYLFRLPHLDMGLPREELIEEIATTLIHEVAHYFGIDDDHLDEIGWG